MESKAPLQLLVDDKNKTTPSKAAFRKKTGFQLYMLLERASLAAKYPFLTAHQIKSKVAQTWTKLDQATKDKYKPVCSSLVKTPRRRKALEDKVASARSPGVRVKTPKPLLDFTPVRHNQKQRASLSPTAFPCSYKVFKNRLRDERKIHDEICPSKLQSSEESLTFEASQENKNYGRENRTATKIHYKAPEVVEEVPSEPRTSILRGRQLEFGKRTPAKDSKVGGRVSFGTTQEKTIERVESVSTPLSEAGFSPAVRDTPADWIKEHKQNKPSKGSMRSYRRLKAELDVYDLSSDNSDIYSFDDRAEARDSPCTAASDDDIDSDEERNCQLICRQDEFNEDGDKETDDREDVAPDKLPSDVCPGLETSAKDTSLGPVDIIRNDTDTDRAESHLDKSKKCKEHGQSTEKRGREISVSAFFKKPSGLSKRQTRPRMKIFPEPCKMTTADSTPESTASLKLLVSNTDPAKSTPKMPVGAILKGKTEKEDCTPLMPACLMQAQLKQAVKLPRKRRRSEVMSDDSHHSEDGETKQSLARKSIIEVKEDNAKKFEEHSGTSQQKTQYPRRKKARVDCEDAGDTATATESTDREDRYNKHGAGDSSMVKGIQKSTKKKQITLDKFVSTKLKQTPSDKTKKAHESERVSSTKHTDDSVEMTDLCTTYFLDDPERPSDCAAKSGLHSSVLDNAIMMRKVASPEVPTACWNDSSSDVFSSVQSPAMSGISQLSRGNSPVIEFVHGCLVDPEPEETDLVHGEVVDAPRFVGQSSASDDGFQHAAENTGSASRRSDSSKLQVTRRSGRRDHNTADQQTQLCGEECGEWPEESVKLPDVVPSVKPQKSYSKSKPEDDKFSLFDLFDEISPQKFKVPESRRRLIASVLEEDVEKTEERHSSRDYDWSEDIFE